MARRRKLGCHEGVRPRERGEVVDVVVDGEFGAGEEGGGGGVCCCCCCGEGEEGEGPGGSSWMGHFRARRGEEVSVVVMGARRHGQPGPGEMGCGEVDGGVGRGERQRKKRVSAGTPVVVGMEKGAWC